MLTNRLLTHHLPVVAHYPLLTFFALTIFTGASAAKAQSQSGQAKKPSVHESLPVKRGLDFSIGSHGFESLSFNGQSLLASPEKGELRPQKSVFRAVLDALLPRSSPGVAAPNKKGGTVDLSYPWGRVSCSYGKQGDKITMRIDVSNAGDKAIDQLSLRLMELNFPSAPKGGTLEAGMFGFGFKGPEWPLDQCPASIPTVADPQFVVPIVRMDYGAGTVNFCSDDLESSVEVPYSTNSPISTSYPLVATCRDIKPHGSKTFNVSLRFGPSGARVQDLSSDVLEGYAKKYPFEINWKDRRPIGAIFLAGPQINVATNPRRWIVNYGRIDVTTEQGKAAFREALLKLADNSVQVLKDTGAQGMITWDPEGEEFLAYSYYGDPRLVPTLAPEMEFKNDGAKSVIDEYFEKFRAAGLRTGVCIRPQQIAMIDGKPVHQPTDDEQALHVLRERIAYAKQRWGCTLFYVDSTATAGRPLYPDVFQTVAQAHPDILLIPENESMRYFACSAPLNSYMHHRVISTPAGARMVYPKSFSVLMTPDGDRPEDHDGLVTAVRRGDILLFNGWYKSDGTEKIKELYEEAGVTPQSKNESSSSLQ
ncbi:MAG: hypothetical protein DMF24_05055 [Verrucomicrobia bacterium]|nr:MAG: hypothetical protein DMF24_05055 [Verrucomicrobiota bacterium]